MITLACFLEEQSARAFLEGVLPRLLPDDVHVRFIVFEGKSDLEKQLPLKLRKWLEPNTVFLILRDKDAGDCRRVKANLQDICKKSGRPDVLIRIACHELESYYFGDLSAVEKGLGIKNLAAHARKAAFREPDKIEHPARELGRITNNGYQKVGGSRAIGVQISLTDNTSHSFTVLLSGVKAAVERCRNSIETSSPETTAASNGKIILPPP